MFNKIVRYSLLLFLMCSLNLSAQRERSMARKGNRFYADSTFTKAEVAYLKALSENPDFEEAQYNLANTSIRQKKFDEALEQLEALTGDAEEGTEAAEIYHNMGNTYLGKYQTSLQDQEKAKSAGEILDKAIDAYKQSLRYNATDNETRYNLAVAQKLKKEGPPPQEQKQDQKDQDKKDQDKKDQDKKDQDQKDQDQKDQKDQKDQQKEQQDQQKGQQQQPDKISKEDAEKILNAMMQEEKELQEDQKEKQKAKARSVRVEKEW